MATIKIIQRTKALSNGLYPIFLRITKDRKSKFISLNLSCEKFQWNETKSEFRKSYPNFKQLNHSLIEVKNRAEKIISDVIAKGEDVTLHKFEELFFDFKKGGKTAVKDFWEDKIRSLVESKSVGNARAYRDTKNSFFKFAGEKRPYYFNDITPELLNRYEVFLRSNDGTDGGISVKMRTIRALYNDAIEENIASKEQYPFKTYKISKLKNANNKRALNIDDIEKIKKLDIAKHPDLIDSRNYFIFSYYTRGMNFYDMMMLEWNDIEVDKINYTRRKTKRTFNIKIVEPVQEILDYYKNINKKTKYIFPILTSNELTPMQIEYRKDKTLKKFNRDLKRIAKVCKIGTKITSYVARHSFATNLKQKGVSTDIISEAMGHQNLSITQAYLKELENDVVDDAMNKLL